MFSPVLLLLIALAACVVLVVLCTFSVKFYADAKRLNPLREKRDALKQEIAACQAEISDLVAQRAAKEKDIAEARKLIGDGILADKFIADHKETLLRFRSEEECAKKDAIQARDGAEKAKKALATKKLELHDAEVALDVATRQKSELDKEIIALQTQATKAGTAVATLEKKKAELDGANKELQTANDALGGNIKTLREEHGKLSGICEQLRKDRDELEKKIGELERTRGGLAGSVEFAKKIIGESKVRRRVWDSLEEKVFPKIDLREPGAGNVRPKKALGDENDWLIALKRNLRDAGFRFSNRTLRAFHTSLKCFEWSPLIVLAGISGTGKSLLPELYARALGANFLAVPVRPSWDNPSELVGFYNYADAKFNATALSRLLWQTSTKKIVEPDGNAEKPAATERFELVPANDRAVNFILLDEMNLARVEYYFSDMLSLMEMLRGGNEDVCIVLEAGANAPRQISLAFNNLFIGTMNEDETTQMLSDKVLDRANVLRFGCPEHLNATPNKQVFLEKYADAAAPRVSFGDWKAWRKLPNGKSLTNEMVKDLETLKNAMNLVGKPFGYRVADAVRAYVANYPNATGTTDANAAGTKSNEASNNAFSDQIEMKILPKLNGLDGRHDNYDEAMDAVGKIVEKYNDEALCEEFESAAEAGKNSFFTWRGVKR